MPLDHRNLLGFAALAAAAPAFADPAFADPADPGDPGDPGEVVRLWPGPPPEMLLRWVARRHFLSPEAKPEGRG